MSRDLLSAIGTRLEARLNRADARLHAGADVAKTNAAISNLIPFTLLDDTQSAPAAASSSSPMAASAKPTVPTNVPSSFETSSTAAMTTVEISEPESIMDQVIDQVMGAGRAVSGVVMQDSSQVDLMVKAQVMASATLSAPVGADVGTGQPTPAADAGEPAHADANVPSANVAAVVLPPNYTPAVPPEFYPGATFVPRGLSGEPPMTVTRLGDGVVFAVWTDAEGSREMAFHPNQLDLVTPAP